MEPNAEFLTKRITEGAVKFIKKNQDAPFFLYVPHPIPHAPLHVSPPFMEGVSFETVAKLNEADGNIDYRTRHRLFRQAIAEIDWSVGRILDALQTEPVGSFATMPSFGETASGANGMAAEIRAELGDWNMDGSDRPARAYPGNLNRPDFSKKRPDR